MVTDEQLARERRQLLLMRERLAGFTARALSLPLLINNLEALVWELELAGPARSGAFEAVVTLEVRPPFGLRLTFDDGLTREVDLADDLRGPMFDPLRDPAFFDIVTVDHGTVVWPNGVDLDPLVLHGDFEPAGTESERRVV